LVQHLDGCGFRVACETLTVEKSIGKAHAGGTA
jgi:hypothetical protein